MLTKVIKDTHYSLIGTSSVTSWKLRSTNRCVVRHAFYSPFLTLIKSPLAKFWPSLAPFRRTWHSRWLPLRRRFLADSSATILSIVTLKQYERMLAISFLCSLYSVSLITGFYYFICLRLTFRMFPYSTGRGRGLQSGLVLYASKTEWFDRDIHHHNKNHDVCRLVSTPRLN